jgi:hypothetical protein
MRVGWSTKRRPRLASSAPPNAWRSSVSRTLKLALANKHQLLLTATPLQNSLLELFGLVSFIDEHAFGHLKSFREQFANLTQEQVFQTLKARLKPLCHRTLRRQVTSYVRFSTVIGVFGVRLGHRLVAAYELAGASYSRAADAK